VTPADDEKPPMGTLLLYEFRQEAGLRSYYSPMKNLRPGVSAELQAGRLGLEEAEPSENLVIERIQES
jgi:hypothetical protein